jgi:hypothetical protein
MGQPKFPVLGKPKRLFPYNSCMHVALTPPA